MGQSIPFGQHIARPPMSALAGARALARVDSIPWTIWCMVAGTVSGMIGAVGHCVAHVDWARHVLDSCAHHDSDDRRAGGDCVRVYGFDGDVWARYREAGSIRKNLGISRAAGSVHCGVGLHCDADVGAVRQLVA